MFKLGFFRNRKRKPAPNVLLTNFCNQSCPYCFAQEEMRRSGVKEMSLEDFKKVVKIFKKNGIEVLRLMGGEPTLHSQFKEIIKIGTDNFKEVLVFTNGLIPDKNEAVLEKNIEKINFNFNIDTPAYINSLEKRKKIIKLIKRFSKKTKVNVGFTISDLKRDYKDFLKDFDKETLSKVGVRFGFAKAIVGQKPFFSKKDYQKLGKKIFSLITSFKSMGIDDIFIDCGLLKEMFNSKDRSYLLKNANINGWGCKGKWSSFDIAPDLTTFACFPFYRKRRLHLDNFSNFKANITLKKLKSFYS